MLVTISSFAPRILQWYKQIQSFSKWIGSKKAIGKKQAVIVILRPFSSRSLCLLFNYRHLGSVCEFSPISAAL